MGCIERPVAHPPPQCKPVYLGFPTDLFHVKVSSEGLKTPLVRPIPPPSIPANPLTPQPYPHSAPPLPSSEENTLSTNPVLSHVIDEITQRFKAAKKPIAIIDVCADRFGCGPGLRELVEKSGIRFFESSSALSSSLVTAC